MTRILPTVFFIVVLLPHTPKPGQGIGSSQEETFRFEEFGAVRVYRQRPHPPGVVLFFSGEGGWNEPAAGMAKTLASLDSLVVGIDLDRYLSSLARDGEPCSYYSSDIEDLSHYIQQRLGFPEYVFPILAGYSSGGALVYATLVQAPTGTFRAGVSLGFCSNLLLPKPPCRGSGLQWKTIGSSPKAKRNEYDFRPAPGLAVPWTVLMGDEDTTCKFGSTAAFVKQVGGSRLVTLPHVDHGFSPRESWMPRLKEEYKSLVRSLNERSSSPQAPAVKDLPLVEIPAAGASSDVLAVVISGDGGWAGIDRDLGRMLADNNVSVVGVNSLQYFWTRRTPDTAAADLSRILQHYLAVWNKRRVILVGYSMGADVLPFMAARLPAGLLSKVVLIAMLGLSPSVDFEFHFVNWLGRTSRKTDLAVAPEVEKLRGKRMLCVYGVEEEGSLCRTLSSGLVLGVPMKDGHHFGGDYRSIAETILKEAAAR
jgi:type IV secretory pathway VirJ component